MIYDALAKYYDALVKDEEATNSYVDFIMKHMQGKTILELACGSGEISLALAKCGMQIDASDFSTQMLDVAKSKDLDKQVNYFELDMRNIHVAKHYDAVICLCDSMNYLEETDLEATFSSVYAALKPQGTFIFDMHSIDRLQEFAEEFYEAGIADGVEYTWSIISDDQKLYHNFIFYDENGNPYYENHVQNVFDATYVRTLLKACGFTVDIYTDFGLQGIQPGEKYFYVCRKDSK